ncbi:hypothetical protein B0T24DRAFT_603670 [Lasiosphaeria ovina]|uniref:Uncharacterized protein n=1 Tax=Lasiosphaeria ovina TaxID=92902 RepID=A0AAE0NKA2_9PEZI|nr:hypothetical protein B0T24DRAFT_603670 [Lasiosphaeria ovina]
MTAVDLRFSICALSVFFNLLFVVGDVSRYLDGVRERTFPQRILMLMLMSVESIYGIICVNHSDR